MYRCFSHVVIILIAISILALSGCKTVEMERKRADRYFERGMYAKAIDKYDLVRQLEGDTFLTMYSLGKSSEGLSNWAKACEYFAQARDFEPRFPDTYVRLANCYTKLGQDDKVKETWETLLTYEKKHLLANAALASIYFDLQNYNQAEAHYKIYLQEKPDDVIVRSALGAALVAQQKYQAAIIQLKLALKTDPTCVLCHFNLGVAYLGAGNHEEAERAFIVVTGTQPAYQEGWVYLAAAYARMGRNLKAIETLERAVTYGFNDWPRIEGDSDFTTIIAHVRYLELRNKP